MHYLSTTTELCIQYSPHDPENGLLAYCDTDYAGDKETSWSTIGYSIFLANRTVSWLSWWQRRVRLSSTEAEYCGLTKVVKQLKWIRNLLTELGYELGPFPICCDNQGAILITSNPVQDGHLKHVEHDDHYICEALEFKEVELFYVSTDKQTADIFMKNLGCDKFIAGRYSLCLIQLSTSKCEQWGGVLEIKVFSFWSSITAIMILGLLPITSCDISADYPVQFMISIMSEISSFYTIGCLLLISCRLLMTHSMSFYDIPYLLLYIVETTYRYKQFCIYVRPALTEIPIIRTLTSPSYKHPQFSQSSTQASHSSSLSTSLYLVNFTQSTLFLVLSVLHQT